jgi:hypothetical protein
VWLPAITHAEKALTIWVSSVSAFMRIAITLVACGAASTSPIGNRGTGIDPLSELEAIDAGLCACTHQQSETFGVLAELDDHAHRCFQAAIGDPLPPRRR